MAAKLTHWLVLTLVLSLGFGQLTRFEIGSLVIYAHDLLITLLLIVNIRSLFKLKLAYGVKIFCLGLIISWVVAMINFPLSALTVPLMYTLRLFAYMLAYLVLTDQDYQLDYRVYLLSGGISLVLGLAQYFLLPDLRVFYYLGWDDHLHRLTFPHFDPAFSGIMLGLYLLIYLPLIRPVTASLVIYPSFLFLGILLTYARSVWLSLFLAAVIYLKNKKLVFLILMMFLFALLILPRRFGEGNNLLRTYSITSRLNYDLAYLQANRQYWLTGRGYNTLILDSPKSDLPNHVSGPNNSYLLLLLTTGIFGLLGFLKIIYRLYSLPHLRLAAIFLLLASLFNNALLYSFSLLLLLLSSFLKVRTSA